MADRSIRLAADVSLSIEELLATRLLIGGNSGSGKSYVQRKICEQVANLVPTFILDREGEYASLRERCDVVLVGKGGEVDTHVSTAGKLARKLMELRTSAVIDLYELDKNARRRFVRLFLESLLSLPRRLWGPTFVFIDECHEFAPESGREIESTDAVIALMDQGRKRGLCGIPATQRLSKIAKDVTSETNNLLLGRFAQDVDLRRVSDLLGFSGKSEWAAMQSFKPGDFFAMGPAFRHDGVKRFHVERVETTHVRPGQRYDLEPPRPSNAILKVAPELADLKHQVEQEQNETETLRQRVRDLEGGAELRKLRARVAELEKGSGAPVRAPATKGPTLAVDRRAVQTQIETAIRNAHAGIAEHVDGIRGAVAQIGTQQRELEKGLKTIDRFLKTEARAVGRRPVPLVKVAGQSDAQPDGQSQTASSSRRRRESLPIAEGQGKRAVRANLGTDGGKRRILIALSMHPEGLSTADLAIYALFTPSSGTYRNYRNDHRVDGAIGQRDDKKWYLTESGARALGDCKPLPLGRDLIAWWLDHFGVSSGKAKMLSVLIETGAEGLTVEDLAVRAEYAVDSGTYRNYRNDMCKTEVVLRRKGKPMRFVAHGVLIEAHRRSSRRRAA